jgi:hypothetical protein
MRRRLSKDEIFRQEEDSMSETVKHPGHVFIDDDGNLKPLENDYYNNGARGLHDPRFRWNGADVTKRTPPLTAAQLDEIRAKAPKKQPTFFERAEAAKRSGVELKPSVVVISKQGTEKLQ